MFSFYLLKNEKAETIPVFPIDVGRMAAGNLQFVSSLTLCGLFRIPFFQELV